MTSLPIQDWEALQQQYPKPDLLKKVLQSFVRNHSESAAELQGLLASGDPGALGAYAHKLKGAAQIMRASLPAGVAAELESRIHQTGRADPELVTRLATLMTRWLAEISTKLAAL